MNKLSTIALSALVSGVTATGVFYFSQHSGKTILSAEKGIPVRYASYSVPENAINFTTAAEKSVNAVVHVTTETQVSNFQSSNFYDPFHEFFFGPQRQLKQQPQVGSGSGVIISEDGYIVTNNHVVDQADEIHVTLNDNRKYSAKIIGKDPATDLALLKIDEKSLPYLPYGNSDDVRLGEWVLAVGNPFNLTSTVTAGIVSAKGRNIQLLNEEYAVESFIQTDAAVNPGNSGGALVNTNGELVGINSAIASTTGSYAGYAFAIPVNLARKVVDDLLEYGEVQRAFIGVSIRDIDQRLSEEKKIPVQKGVYVNGLTQGGGAEKAGLKEGDIIFKLNETPVNSMSELQEQVARHRPGDKIDVHVRRGDQSLAFAVVLNNKLGNTNPLLKSNSETIESLGAKFSAPSADEKRRLGIKNGVKISELNGGKLRNAGIKEGFIITHIDRKTINSVEDINDALESKKGGILIEGYYPNGMRSYYGFGM
ncbi:MAG: Do family serine endopeptidase [Bacteroidia bacterium]|nr:Do family serine endopeptidase [Bacteroidia bacterium]